MSHSNSELYQWLGVAGLVLAFTLVVVPLSAGLATVNGTAGSVVLLAGVAGLWYANRRFGFVGS